MENKKNNYQLYERLEILLKQKKPWSKRYLNLIDDLEAEPDYPIDDPLIFELMKFTIAEIKNLAPHLKKRVIEIEHILEVDFQTFDSYHYSLLSTHFYDLSEHLYGLRDPHLPPNELKKAKIKSLARLIESLAAVCANNAQII